MSVSLLIVLFLGMSVMRPDALLAMEREAAIVEGARQEGEVIIWAVGEIQFQTMVVDRFKKKYPFMRKVDVVRVAPERLRTRLFAEAQTGKKSNVDVLGLSGFELFYMSNKGFFAPYKSPEADAIMEGFKDPTGYWASYYVNTLVTAYNSKLVQPKELPRGWEDLLDSKWKGNIAFFEEEYEWFANFLKVAGRDKGLAFMRQLAQQDLLFRGGHTQMVELLAAGEFPMMAVAFAPRVSLKKAQGAPVDWLALDPVFSNPIGVGMYESARHPNAAKLFIDHMLSREVQQEVWVNEAWKGSARRDVILRDPRWRGVRIIPFDLSLAQRYEEIAREFRETFLPGKGVSR